MGLLINPKFVRNGAIACAEEGLSTIIALELFKGEEFALNRFLSDRRFRKLVEEKRIILQTSPWISFAENDEKILTYIIQAVIFLLLPKVIALVSLHCTQWLYPLMKRFGLVVASPQ